VRGKIDQVTGRAKEYIGRATGDPVLKKEGADQKSAGDVEQGVGKARRKIGEAIRDIGKKIGK
jgi:uncharacterized protein YjbJ (UPF0337 family)